MVVILYNRCNRQQWLYEWEAQSMCCSPLAVERCTRFQQQGLIEVVEMRDVVPPAQDAVDLVLSEFLLPERQLRAARAARTQPADHIVSPARCFSYAVPLISSPL